MVRGACRGCNRVYEYMTEGIAMRVLVQVYDWGLDAKQHPPSRLLFIILAILPLIYYLIIWLLNNTPQAKDYTFVYRWIIYEAIGIFNLITLIWFFWFELIIIDYLDWLLAGLSWLSLYHFFVLHQSLSSQYILWLSLQSSKVLLLIVIFPDIP